MDSRLGPSKSELEIFEFARAKASTEEEREGVEALIRLRESLSDTETRAQDSVDAGKAKRGGTVRALTQSEQAWLQDLTEDTGLPEAVRRWNEQLPTSREVLKQIAYGLKLMASSKRGLLRYFHDHDRSIEQTVIDHYEHVAGAFFRFIGDQAYCRKTCREIAMLSIATNRSSCAVYAVLDTENDHVASTNGKSIGAAYDLLEALAIDRQSLPLSNFLGYAEQGSDDWFEPCEGLRTLNALIEQLSLSSTKARGKRALQADLRQLADVLAMAERRGAKFHLEFDI